MRCAYGRCALESERRVVSRWQASRSSTGRCTRGSTAAVIVISACTRMGTGRRTLGCMSPGSASRLAAGRRSVSAESTNRCRPPRPSKQAIPLTLLGCADRRGVGVFAPARAVTETMGVIRPAAHAAAAPGACDTGPSRAGPDCYHSQGVPGSAARKVPCDALNLAACWPRPCRCSPALHAAVIRTAGCRRIQVAASTALRIIACGLLDAVPFYSLSRDLSDKRAADLDHPVPTICVISPYRQARLGPGQGPMTQGPRHLAPCRSHSSLTHTDDHPPPSHACKKAGHPASGLVAV